MKSEKKKVFVGLSGGADSSVAALKLIEAGHDVVGVFIKTWQPNFLDCNWEKERIDAMRVAAHLNIPFLTFDGEEAYKTEVAEYMISEYTRGRTPNPDVMCNRHVKFGAFLNFALEKGADAVATGHYARVLEDNNGYHLYRGIDTEKDQSYFLWTLTQKQLQHIMFPVGSIPKSEVRKSAKKDGLPTAQKKDSQGICFLGPVDIEDFLSHYINLKEGLVLNDRGESIGTHSGALIYTLGQRHGFQITESSNARKAHYVISRDIEKNTITVAENPPKSVEKEIILEDKNEIQSFEDRELTAQFRYRGEALSVSITEKGSLKTKDPMPTPSSGQSCVLYRGDECLGGGIIA